MNKDDFSPTARCSLATLLFTMLKIGLFTFGGGYAMIALLEAEFVTKRAWLEREEFLDMVAIAESTPGPIAINAATYVGYKQAGIPGSIAATVGMVLPSFIIIYLISSALDNFLEIAWIAQAFRGIKIGVGLLIFNVALTMLKKMKKKRQPRIIAGCAFAIMLTVNFLALNLSTITLLIAAGSVSLAIFAAKQKGGAAK